jgi:hypothetical protein
VEKVKGRNLIGRSFRDGKAKILISHEFFFCLQKTYQNKILMILIGVRKNNFFVSRSICVARARAQNVGRGGGRHFGGPLLDVDFFIR